VALNPADEPGPYPAEVKHVVGRDTLADYYHGAWALNRCGVDVVSVQHEFGIWGGESGSFVLDFVAQLRVPAVVTLHTILREPTWLQRTIIARLVDAAAATVVMSRSAASWLAAKYGIDPGRVTVIPHGVPGLPASSPATIRLRRNFGGGPLILSFGLIGPGKGYETAIGAMPAVVEAFPDASYVVVGATHPDIVRRDGESYRHGLEDLARQLGVADHVRFVNRFVEPGELGSWLAAADIFVTPYPNLEQIVSGTLAYAMGAGKAIVSTPYAYATEMLARDRGLLVEPGEPDALAEAFIHLLHDEPLRARLARRAYEHSRSMLWPVVAGRYEALFAQVVDAPARVTWGVGAGRG
jgi:glycosyltransferase involved in cell wall biosynthesis